MSTAQEIIDRLRRNSRKFETMKDERDRKRMLPNVCAVDLERVPVEHVLETVADDGYIITDDDFQRDDDETRRTVRFKHEERGTSAHVEYAMLFDRPFSLMVTTNDDELRALILLKFPGLK